MRPKLHRAAKLRILLRLGALVVLVAAVFLIDFPVAGLDPAWVQTAFGLIAAALALGPVQRLERRRYGRRVTAPRAVASRA